MRRILFFLSLAIAFSSNILLFHSAANAATSVFEKRFKQIKKQAVSGDKKAQYRLGLAYMLGNEVKVDIREAIYWLEKSAKQDYVKAAHKIGVLYFNNRDGKQNYSKAAQWFTVAAKRSYAPAQYFLAKMYFVGKGVKRDYDKALLWSARAGKNGMDTKRQLVQIEHAIKTRVNVASAKPAKTVSPPKKTRPRRVVRAPKVVTPRKTRAGFTSRTRRHVLELVLSGFWQHKGKAADHMPSSVNKCTEKKGAIHCDSERISRSTENYRADYKINSTFFNFNRSGQFNIQYRVTYLFVLPFDSDDPNPSYEMPSAGRSKTVTILSCQVLGNQKIRCLSQDKKSEEYYTKS